MGSIRRHRSAPGPVLDRTGYEVEVDERFDGRVLDERLWIPYYLPHWSSREASAARYDVAGGTGGTGATLRLRIDTDQPPWCPEWDDGVRVSSLQTGQFSGPLGSGIGQHRFRDGLIVREEQEERALYVPRYGLFELQARATDDPRSMVALWMIGYEDEPTRSAEICICEIFGRDVGPAASAVGMGVHPFGDPSIRDDFSTERLPLDARGSHAYAAVWTADHVAFYVDDRLVKVVPQSPSYPMQFMLSIYELTGGSEAAPDARAYPKTFLVERFRGYRPTLGPTARPSAFSHRSAR